jgi:hypothetical protein
MSLGIEVTTATVDVHDLLPPDRRGMTTPLNGLAHTPWRSRATAWMRRERLLLGTLFLAVAYFAYRWATDLQRPGLQTPEGWRGYVDQGFYFREATHLANLDAIPAVDFKYGPGYPALAAPFTLIGEFGWPSQDPFAPVNASVWLLTIAATFLVGRRLGGQWVGLAAAIAVMFATPLINYITLPWNSTAVLGALDVVLLVSLASGLRWWHGALLGGSVALAYSSRYADALWIAIAASTVLLARRAGVRSAALWTTVAASVIAAIPTMLLQNAAFGNPFTTPYGYNKVVTAAQFRVGDIPSHAAQTFVSPFFFGAGEGILTPGLLSSFFLLGLAPVGAVMAFRRARGPARVLILGMVGSSLLTLAFYMAYWFTSAYGLQFGAVHFFKMWWPLWTVAAVIAVVGIASLLLPPDDSPGLAR